MKKLRIVCWGAGNSFIDCLSILKKEIEKGNIILSAIIDNKKKSICDREIIRSYDLDLIEFDYVIITSIKYFYDIKRTLIAKNIPQEKIVDYRILYERDFDFLEYVRNGWIDNQIINNTISELSYDNANRKLKGKNIEVIIGRKSYISSIHFDNRELGHYFSMTVGNFTSISEGINIEIGLNLDHDYNRITNYGLSHLSGFSDHLELLKMKNYELSIGSDVWIGQNATIKSGITIGDGAVIASNSYVVSDVPDYAIVGGNPAKVIKFRFDESTIRAIKDTQWWNMSEEELIKYKDYFDDPLMFIEKVGK